MERSCAPVAARATASRLGGELVDLLAEPRAGGAGDAGVERGGHHLAGVADERLPLVEHDLERHRTATEVDVEILESTFLAGFATARPAPAYVMDDVAVTWTPADPPVGRAPRAA